MCFVNKLSLFFSLFVLTHFETKIRECHMSHVSLRNIVHIPVVIHISIKTKGGVFAAAFRGRVKRHASWSVEH